MNKTTHVVIAAIMSGLIIIFWVGVFVVIAGCTSTGYRVTERDCLDSGGVWFSSGTGYSCVDKESVRDSLWGVL